MNNQKKTGGLPKKILYIAIDIGVVLFSYLVFAWIKPGTKNRFILEYYPSLLVFLGIWIFVSLMISKYNFSKKTRLQDVEIPIIISNFTILSVVSILIYFLDVFYSRMVVFGTVLLSTGIEMLLVYIYHSFEFSTEIETEMSVIGTTPAKEAIPAAKVVSILKPEVPDKPEEKVDATAIASAIVEEVGEEPLAYISRFIDLESARNIFVSTTTRFNIKRLAGDHYYALINLKRINDIQRINKFFETVNSKLPDGGVFIDWAETNALRKKKILNHFPVVLNYIVYSIDFLFRRVFPKMAITQKVYFFLTKGRNRALSRAESLGRLYSCGFEVVDETTIEDHLYFVARKVGKPAFDYNPTYGPVIRLRRLGKNGKEIKVYKMRTMHPYSEYIQGYVFEKYSLQAGGKFKDDFRISTLGRIMRKLWIDELPMLVNLLKGDLKIMGVRPLSKHYFSLYTKELQERRIKHKPGLVPPFYVDLPVTLDEIMASENKYLDAYEKSPLLTDVSYFFKAFYNIIFKHARSK
ncbi:MAG: sugar transferase [Bacteroidetes bacterium]|nr:sugar transferase [Bacteroidota bacterium]